MRFVDHPDVDIISFTGSCQVGQKIATRVQARFGKIILELGGNNAIIIDTDANLDLAIPAIVFGAVGTAGQRCTTTRRVFVHQSQLQQIREQLCHAYEQITIGDPAHASTLMGPLIDQAAVTDYLKAITAIQQQGGSILTGGKKHPLGGNFVYPTLAYVPHNIPIVQAETFSPICYLIAYQTLTEAITAQNNVSQGLSSALFTNRLSAAEQFLSHAGSDCGLANINIGTSGAEIGGAFGGEKHTGGGREAGSDAWQSYMRRQTNTINWGKTLPLAQGIQFNISNKK
jgi:aldehyde dehydrogenase (NAD+)